MKQGGGGMEAREPHDGIAEDGVYLGNRFSDGVGLRNDWRNIPQQPERQGMALQPGARHRRQGERKQ